MFKGRWRVAVMVLLMLSVSSISSASPLFPDVPSDHWPMDAVARLAAEGLVDGYPDGTFKGDRSLSRWELAVMVARVLKRSDGQYSEFSSRIASAELLALANALSEELDALGVRVNELDSATLAIGQRVSELERVTFYGSVDSRIVFQSFQNDGALDNSSLRGAAAAGRLPYLNYNSLVGSAAGVPLRPQLIGVIPTVDYRLGRELTNGTGFTSLAILGLKLKVDQDIDAGVEFAAFSSQGDQFVDGYWGVSAPYLSNIFTANAKGGQEIDNVPYTKMTLNSFWVQHKPSKTKLVAGQIGDTKMEPLVYAGQGNLGVYGPSRFPGYGFDLSGESQLGDSDAKIGWEILGTRLGNGVGFQNSNYQSYAINGNLRYLAKRFGAQLDFSRVTEEHAQGGQLLTVGLHGNQNFAFGASNGWAVRQWVNPPGWFANQRSAVEIAQTGVLPNTADTRPIPGWNGGLDNTIGFGAGAGNYGPSSQSTYGLKTHYDIPFNGNDGLHLQGRFAQSQYKPSRNSSYESQGKALVLDIDGKFLENNLNLGITYLKIDPNYSPAAWFGTALGARPVKSFNFTGVGSLYDNGNYPHNRQGLQFKGQWKFDEGLGKLWAKASILRQTKTSLYDVRVTGGALGPAIPTNDVIGFSPGYVDPIFSGYAHPSVYGTGSQNSFNASLSPLEDPRGTEKHWEFGAGHDWRDIGLKLEASVSRHDLRRNSTLSPVLGGSQNEVRVGIDSLTFDAKYKLSPKVTINSGLDYVRAKGHFDPAGLYNKYAISTGAKDFQNLDSTQWIPHLGLDYQISDTTAWGVMGRHYSTRDKVDESVQPGDSNLGETGSSTHPFNWSGWQLSSEFKLTF